MIAEITPSIFPIMPNFCDENKKNATIAKIIAATMNKMSFNRKPASPLAIRIASDSSEFVFTLYVRKNCINL